MGRLLQALRQINVESPQVPPLRARNPAAEPESAPIDRAAAVLARPELAIELWPPCPAEECELAFAVPDDREVTRELAVLECLPAGTDGDQGWVKPDVDVEWVKPDCAQAHHAATAPPAGVDVYAALAERIIASGVTGASRVLMFTSPEDGAGKTDVLIHLAESLADRATGGLLVIDANLRRPDLTTRLGIEAPWGFADVVRGVASWRQAVRPVGAGLWSVLPSRPLSASTVRMPEAFRLDAAAPELRDHFALILLDAPSLAYPEAAAFSRHCDGTYLLVRLGHTTCRAAATAVRVLQRSGGRLLGTVVLEA